MVDNLAFAKRSSELLFGDDAVHVPASQFHVRACFSSKSLDVSVLVGGVRIEIVVCDFTGDGAKDVLSPSYLIRLSFHHSATLVTWN